MKRSAITAFAAMALTACAAQGGKTATSAAETGKGTTRAAETPMVGGYTAQRPLEDRDKQLFEKVMEKLVGVKYTPESVATQVVAGVNYRFICEAETCTRKPEAFKAAVTIFQPLPGRGEPRLTDIKRL